MSNYQWKWMDVPISFYKNKSLSDLSDLRNSGHPLALVTHWGEDSGFVTVNLIAPLNMIFWSVADSGSYVYNKMYGTSVFGSDYSRGKDKKLILKNNERFSNEFIKKMINKNINKFSLNVDYNFYFWFHDICWRTGMDKKINKKINAGIYSFFDFDRIFPCTIFLDELPNFKKFMDEELCQLNEFSFIPLDERHSSDKLRWYSYSNLSQIFYAISNSNNFRLHSMEMNYDNIEFIKKSLNFDLNESIYKINFWIEILEGGGVFSDFSEPLSMVRENVLMIPHSLGNEDEDLVRLLLSSRARLVRLLGWPTHYMAIRRIIYPKEFMISMESDDDFRDKFREWNIKEPYDAEEELKQYLVEVEQKYPIVRKWIP